MPKAITASTEIAALASVRLLISEADQNDVANSAQIERKNPTKENQNPLDSFPRCGPASSGICESGSNLRPLINKIKINGIVTSSPSRHCSRTIFAVVPTMKLPATKPAMAIAFNCATAVCEFSANAWDPAVLTLFITTEVPRPANKVAIKVNCTGGAKTKKAIPSENTDKPIQVVLERP